MKSNIKKKGYTIKQVGDFLFQILTCFIVVFFFSRLCLSCLFFFYLFFYYQFTGSEKQSSVTESVNTKQNPLPLYFFFFFYNKNLCFSFSLKTFEQNSKKYSSYLKKPLAQKSFCCNQCDTSRSHVSDSYLVFHVFFIKNLVHAI